MGKNISNILGSQKLFDRPKQPLHLIGNAKTSPQHNSVTNEKEIFRERYMSPD